MDKFFMDEDHQTSSLKDARLASSGDILRILGRIVALNHAWKIAREDFGSNHNITQALRRQKASWQASLIRFFPGSAYFTHDQDNVDGEALLSVRLSTPLNFKGTLKKDAEHMPLRIAKELFTSEELATLIH